MLKKITGKIKNQRNHKEYNKGICIWEQNINAYLEFTGKVHKGKREETHQFDRRLCFSAKNSILHVKGKDIDICYDYGVVVKQPRIKTQKRDTKCEQITRIVEHSVYLDLGHGKSVRIIPGLFILAFRNNIVVVHPHDIHCDCVETAVKMLDSKKVEHLPSAHCSAIVRVEKK